MPGRTGRRVVPIREKDNTIKFRLITNSLTGTTVFISGQTSGSQTIWASCIAGKTSGPHGMNVTTPALMTPIGAITFRPANMTSFSQPCSRDIGKQIKTRKKIVVPQGGVITADLGNTDSQIIIPEQ